MLALTPASTLLALPRIFPYYACGLNFHLLGLVQDPRIILV